MSLGWFDHTMQSEPTRTTPNLREPQRCLGKQDERAVSSAFRVVRSGSRRFGEKSVPEVLWEVLPGRSLGIHLLAYLLSLLCSLV